MKIYIEVDLTSEWNHNKVFRGLENSLKRLFKSCYIGNYRISVEKCYE